MLSAQTRRYEGGRSSLRRTRGTRASGSFRGFNVRPFPPLAEISDLLITRKVKDSAKQILNLTQLSFHQIRKNEITQVACSAFPGSGVYGRLRVNTLAGGGCCPDSGGCYRTPDAAGAERRETWGG